jgi:2TM domain
VLIYDLVNAFLVVIWAVTSGGGALFWPVFPILGWGIGLAANAWGVCGRSRSPRTKSGARRTGFVADPAALQISRPG